jgi:subtilase family serine protease
MIRRPVSAKNIRRSETGYPPQEKIRKSVTGDTSINDPRHLFAIRGRRICKWLCAMGVAVVGLAPGCGVSASSAARKDCLTQTRPPLCYTPKQLREAYGVQALLDRGIDGRGRTVVLLGHPYSEPTFDASNIEQDLSRFDSRFDLASVQLELASASGQPPSVGLATPEEVLDVEMVHAIAPGARIRLVLVEGESGHGALPVEEAAFRAAVRQNTGDVISLSGGIDEGCTEPAGVAALHSTLRLARDQRITVLAPSGDFGAAAHPCGPSQPKPTRGVELPASDPLVTAVGGTRLLASPYAGRYESETAWSTPPQRGAGAQELSAASGGGFSSLFSRPEYQAGVAGIGSWRGLPDVSADADPSTGFARVIYRGGKEEISSVGGTSVAVPLWASLVALADQYAGRRLGFINAGLYRIGRSSRYHAAFHDITQGDNTTRFPPQGVAGYRARPGWDPVTGWGSPDAEVLVPLLARYVQADDGRGM